MLCPCASLLLWKPKRRRAQSFVSNKLWIHVTRIIGTNRLCKMFYSIWYRQFCHTQNCKYLPRFNRCPSNCHSLRVPGLRIFHGKWPMIPESMATKWNEQWPFSTNSQNELRNFVGVDAYEPKLPYITVVLDAPHSTRKLWSVTYYSSSISSSTSGMLTIIPSASA